MMDLVSTRADVDAQTQGCARLLAAVIAKAVEDLTVAPTGKERKTATNLQTEPVRSVRFFRSKLFLYYAQLIGVSGEALLEHLVDREIMPLKKDKLTTADYRIIRARLRWALPPMGGKAADHGIEENR